MDAAVSRRMNKTAIMLFLLMMLFLQRPDHGNSSSLTDFTLNFKPPAVGLSDHLTKTQSQPGPAQLPAAGLVHPVERFCHQGDFISGDSATAQPEEASSSEEKPLFASLSDDLLQKLGVPEELIAYVRTLTDLSFDAAKGKMPRDAFEALDYVRIGLDPKEVIAELYGETPAEKAGDMATALQNPITKMQFYVADGEEDLKAMMNAPLELWRVYLHPSQRRIVRKEYKGPARILGGAGTGKTVVAMHRAKELASHCLGNERILFTTFTENLAADIQENLRKICTPDIMKHIEVVHLDQWVNRYLRAHEYPYTIVYGEQITDMWKKAESFTGEDFDLPEGFFQEEWETVVQAQNIQTEGEYAKAPRPGRGIRLDRKLRMRVPWSITVSVCVSPPWVAVKRMIVFSGLALIALSVRLVSRLNMLNDLKRLDNDFFNNISLCLSR